MRHPKISGLFSCCFVSMFDIRLSQPRRDKLGTHQHVVLEIGKVKL